MQARIIITWLTMMLILSRQVLSAGAFSEPRIRKAARPLIRWKRIPSIFIQEYIIIDGFKVRADNGLNAARIIIGSHSAGYYARGLVVKNCEVYGGTTKIVHGDNREGMRVECTEGAVVSGCKVYNFLNVTNNQNTSAFKTYDNNNFIFKNNEIYDSFRGIYIKRRTNGAVVKNNYIHNCNEGLVITSVISVDYNSQRNISIFNNLIIYSDSFSLSDYVQETSDSDNMR